VRRDENPRAFLLCAAVALPASAQTFVVLHSFDYYVDGARPSFGSLVQGTNGNLFGTTFYGPYNSVTGGQYGGAIFEMTPAGKVTTLYEFCAQQGCPDGSSPIMSLFQGSNGNFYGTAGTIFEMTPKGLFTKLYTFCSQPHCTDGSGPSPVVQGRNGNFYGTTGNGGANGIADGTVFEITPKGKLTTLYNFAHYRIALTAKNPSQV
jgi:uncharacterized repeat protein (TIGR03803 family)